MTTEPVETLREIVGRQRFAIRAAEGLGPFGPDVDLVCYHLHEDFEDEGSHQDQDELFRALVAEGARIERDALLDYPYELWERRWPTEDWLDHDVPRIFAVLNRFNHGLYDISYEARGAAGDLYAAAFRDAWDKADSAARPAGCEEEDMSKKAAFPIFNVCFRNAVYAALRAGKLTVPEAVSRMNLVEEEVRRRWPNKMAEMMAQFIEFAPEHQEILDWAIWSVVASPEERRN